MKMTVYPTQTDERQLPCVLPQLSHSLFGGKYDSPFVRAYAPALNAYGIPESSFLSFIDGLNETFIKNPALENASRVGFGLSSFGGPHGALIGKAVKMASKGASKAMSSSRSEDFLDEINANMFQPHGLKVELMPTYKMLQVIGCPPDHFNAGKNSTASSANDIDTVMQQEPMENRMQALHGYVMQLDYHVAAQVESDGYLKRMGERQAAKKAAKQNEKKAEDLADAHHKREEKMSKASEKYFEEVRKLEAKLQDELRKEAGSPGKQDKARREFDKEMDKLERNEGKKMREDMRDANDELDKLRRDEAKEANRVYWIVITSLGWVNEPSGGGGTKFFLKAEEMGKKHAIKSLFG